MGKRRRTRRMRRKIQEKGLNRRRKRGRLRAVGRARRRLCLWVAQGRRERLRGGSRGRHLLMKTSDRERRDRVFGVPFCLLRLIFIFVSVWIVVHVCLTSI